MASRLSPNRSLGRLARTVKNIWTKSEMRRTSQPGSMMQCGAVAFAIRSQVWPGGFSADLLGLLGSARIDSLHFSQRQHNTRFECALGAQNAALVGCPLN